MLEAANGHEAMNVAQQHLDEVIHLLLTNVVMPLMGGRELTKQLKGIHPDVLRTGGTASKRECSIPLATRTRLLSARGFSALTLISCRSPSRRMYWHARLGR